MLSQLQHNGWGEEARGGSVVRYSGSRRGGKDRYVRNYRTYMSSDDDRERDEADA